MWQMLDAVAERHAIRPVDLLVYLLTRDESVRYRVVDGVFMLHEDDVPLFVEYYYQCSQAKIRSDEKRLRIADSDMSSSKITH